MSLKLQSYVAKEALQYLLNMVDKPAQWFTMGIYNDVNAQAGYLMYVHDGAYKLAQDYFETSINFCFSWDRRWNSMAIGKIWGDSLLLERARMLPATSYCNVATSLNNNCEC